MSQNKSLRGRKRCGQSPRVIAGVAGLLLGILSLQCQRPPRIGRPTAQTLPGAG